MSEPKQKEIKLWKAKLEDPDTQKRLEDFQAIVYEICEKHRRITGMQLIRTILPRHEIKTIDSVVYKIMRKRLEKKKDYGYDDLDDLIGIKILCPYLSSTQEVCNWLYEQTEHFKITPKTCKEAYRNKERGYRGYHFTATPNLNKYPQFYDLKCEIQVKTMCQETWDALTHDDTCKREDYIDLNLQKHMKQLSNMLAAIDEQGEILKNQIDELEYEDRDRKNLSAMSYLHRSEPLLDNIKKNYDLDLKWNPPVKICVKDLEALNEAITKHAKTEISENLCLLAALIALCQKNKEQEIVANLLAKNFADNHPRDPRGDDVRASIYWTFGNFNKAIKHGRKALEKATRTNTSVPEYKNQLCYWIADAILSKKLLPQASKKLKDEVRKYAEEVYTANDKDPGFVDTAGYVKVALGETSEEIEQGIVLIRKARQLGDKSKDDYIKTLTEVFTVRHVRIAYLRLGEMLREHIEVYQV